MPPDVEAAIADYPDAVRDRILELRRLVWEVAAADPAIEPVLETLKWGQPSYLPARPRIGTTVRIDRIGRGTDVALFTHCQTSLVDEFRAAHGDLLAHDGTRAIVVPAGGPIPRDELREHIRSALLYHRR
ncbi:DUF1801 domain-containing protein [Demequina muriae]|uniref:YdhG-like domain-containing protein n=1 Tax=Demequina muriae TaxID=3051664 RepID=A0ABT8GEM5_9MICO|nr:DUF1801 domain-containing protein [Demequina sp. EGI L300058]MDN4479887.1 hypothetical protein [Demequina sp. EGI L300058]